MKNLTSFLKYNSISFEDNIDKEKINSSRLLLVVVSLFYVVYSIIDYQGISKETMLMTFPSRVANVMLFIGIFTLTFKQQYFLKHYNIITFSCYFISALVICFSVYFTREGDFSHDLYFAALMGLIFMSFNWSYLPIKNALFMSALIISTFALIKIFVHNDTSGNHFLSFFGQIFYLISVVIVAATAQIIRDNLIKRNITLKDELKLIAYEKNVEAKRQRAFANLDMLTGIPNRRYITERLRDALIEAEQNDTQLTLLFIDLNGFKGINDNYGHDAGDKVLEITAKRIKKLIRKEDYLARLGGDEFLLGFSSTRSSVVQIETYCNKLRKSILNPIAFMGNTLKVGASIGVANYPNDGTDIESLIKVADKDMYIDKQSNSQKQSDGMNYSI